MTRAFLAAAYASADVKQPLALDVFHAARRVFKERIAAVDDNVASLKMRQEMLDELIHRLACLYHQHHAAWALELRHHFLNRMRADDFGALGFIRQEMIHLFHRAIKSDHGESVIVHVQNQVLAHYRQSNQCNISFGFHFRILSELSASSATYDTKAAVPREKYFAGICHFLGARTSVRFNVTLSGASINRQLSTLSCWSDLKVAFLTHARPTATANHFPAAPSNSPSSPRSCR